MAQWETLPLSRLPIHTVEQDGLTLHRLHWYSDEWLRRKLFPSMFGSEKLKGYVPFFFNVPFFLPLGGDVGKTTASKILGTRLPRALRTLQAY